MQKQQMLYEMMTFAQMTGRQVSPDDLEGMDEKAERRVKAGILLGAIARLVPRSGAASAHASVAPIQRVQRATNVTACAGRLVKEQRWD